MTDERPSGLRNPSGSVRGVGSAALAVEGLVLLLAIQPLRVVGAGAAVVATTVLAVVCFTLAGFLRTAWAWRLGWVLQAVVVGCGLVFHIALVVLGILFALLWGYVWQVRRSVLR